MKFVNEQALSQAVVLDRQLYHESMCLRCRLETSRVRALEALSLDEGWTAIGAAAGKRVTLLGRGHALAWPA
jgi:hypothetical protein